MQTPSHGQQDLTTSRRLAVGAHAVDWTPGESVHLAGYPHVRRFSTGTHDPLLTSALCMTDGHETVAMIAVDVLFITHQMARRIRQRLKDAIGLAPHQVLVAATHTHSGPRTTHYLTDGGDPAVALPNDAIVQQCEDAIVAAVRLAHAVMVPAEAALVIADAHGVGSNRHDPSGPTDPQAPLLVLRGRDDHRPIAAVVVYGMHPTVLHEDSTLITGDFPHFCRRLLQQRLLGDATPVLYFTGAAGDQSPRHVTRGNTFAEAQRLGEVLGERLLAAAEQLAWRSDLSLIAQSTHVQLPLRTMPSVAEAQQCVQQRRQRLDHLREQGAPRAEVRTAEVDWFGAERLLTLARAAAEGRTSTTAAERSPTEIQMIALGPWTLVAWPGEIFVEFALQVRNRCPDVFVITYANGENHGYLVTQTAVDRGGYEAFNALFQSPESGQILVRETIKALQAKERRGTAGNR